MSGWGAKSTNKSFLLIKSPVGEKMTIPVVGKIRTQWFYRGDFFTTDLKHIKATLQKTHVYYDSDHEINDLQVKNILYKGHVFRKIYMFLTFVCSNPFVYIFSSTSHRLKI